MWLRIYIPVTGLNMREALFDPFSSITFFKRLVDIINFEHWGVARPPSDILAGFREKYGVEVDDKILQHIHSIKFVNSLCIILKSQPSENNLGPRFLAGQFATIDSNGLQLRESYAIPPSQTQNPWSIRIHPPDEELLRCEQTIRSLISQIDEHKLSMQVLTGQVIEKGQMVQALSAQLDQTTKDLAWSRQEVAGYVQSTSWKITKPIRMIMNLFRFKNR